MANADKNIVITPNISSSTDDPNIVFSGADASTAAQDITMFAYPASSGTLSFEGSSGQLFSITNDLTGVIFSVNDISGIPSLEVNADGTVSIAEFDGEVGIGTAAPTEMLHVQGRDVASSNTGILVQSRGDAFVSLIADTVSDAESNNAYISFSQDEAAVLANMGTVGAADIDAQGNVFTGATNNGLSIHHRFGGGAVEIGVNGAVGLRVDDSNNVTAIGAISGSNFSGSSSGTNTGDNAGVTAVNNGNGMNFTNITSTGTVTMGTPGTLTGSTSNGVTTSSHTHSVTTTGTGNIVASASPTFTGTATFSAMKVNDIQPTAGQHLILNAGESINNRTGQTGEFVYLNAEAGLQVNSSPDNWATGWAGRDTATICGTGGDSSFPGAITATSFGGIASGNLVNKAASEAITGQWTFNNTNLVTGGQFRFYDNVELQFGSSADVDMYFNGEDMYIDMPDGANFNLRGGNANNSMIVALDDSSVNLYYDGTNVARTQNWTAADDLSGFQTVNEAGNMRDVGFAIMENQTVTGARTISPVDAHKTIRITSGSGAINFTSDGNIAIGAVGWIINDSGASKTITATTNIKWMDGVSGVTKTGSRTLEDNGWLTWWKQADTQYYITGTGIS